MKTAKEEYRTLAKVKSPRSPVIRDCAAAFFVGGLICCAGQGFFDLFKALGANDALAKTLVPCTLIFLAAWLTGFGVFDKAAKFAGAGTLVPITGFANAVVSPAIDTKAEGMVPGIGTKIFSIAGPVILYGVLASVIWGVIYYIIGII